MLLIWKCCLNLVCLGIFKISPSQTQIQITERNEMLLLSLISHKPGFNCFTVLFLSLQGLKWSSVMLTGQRISTRSRLDSDWLKDWKSIDGMNPKTSFICSSRLLDRLKSGLAALSSSMKPHAVSGIHACCHFLSHADLWSLFRHQTQKTRQSGNLAGSTMSNSSSLFNRL